MSSREVEINSLYTNQRVEYQKIQSVLQADQESFNQQSYYWFGESYQNNSSVFQANQDFFSYSKVFHEPFADQERSNQLPPKGKKSGVKNFPDQMAKKIKLILKNPEIQLKYSISKIYSEQLCNQLVPKNQKKAKKPKVILQMFLTEIGQHDDLSFPAWFGDFISKFSQRWDINRTNLNAVKGEVRQVIASRLGKQAERGQMRDPQGFKKYVGKFIKQLQSGKIKLKQRDSKIRPKRQSRPQGTRLVAPQGSAPLQQCVAGSSFVQMSIKHTTPKGRSENIQCQDEV